MQPAYPTYSMVAQNVFLPQKISPMDNCAHTKQWIGSMFVRKSVRNSQQVSFFQLSLKQLSKCGPRPFQGASKVKVIFIIILRHHLPFSPSYPHRCTMEFSRGYRMFDFTIKRFAKIYNNFRASLVAQWLRICLPMQGTRVRALVWEDPTCRGAAGPVSHNY